MLMVEIFAEFGEANSGEALLIERVMVAAAKEPVEPKDRKRLHPCIVGAPDVGDVACKLARSRVALSAEHSNPPDFSLAGRRWQSFGKHAHDAQILLRTTVAPHNVVIQNGFELPPLLLGHLGEVFAAVQTLFFSRDRQKNNRRWEFEFVSSFAQNAGAFQANSRPAAIVISSRRGVGHV